MRPPLLLAALTLCGCDQPASVAPAASASASASASTAPSPSGAEPAAPPPADLDVAALQKALKCGGENKAGACGVLAKFATCAAWNPVVPSGDGRWIGHGYVVDGSKTGEQITLLRARRVPTNEVGQGQLGAKIGIAELTKEEGAAFEQADRTIRYFERQDVPPRSNPTVEHIKQRTSFPESSSLRTASGKVYALTQHGAFLCQGAKQTILLVQRTSSRGASGDGLYAELWATSW
jgi:hypothetical protein